MCITVIINVCYCVINMYYFVINVYYRCMKH